MQSGTRTWVVVGPAVAACVGMGVCTPIFASGDDSPPVIESATLSSERVVLAVDGTGRLRVDVRLTGDVGVLDGMPALMPAGVEPTSVLGYPAFSGSRGPAFMHLASGSRRDGVWTVTVGLDRADIGSYDVILCPADAADNTYLETVGRVTVASAGPSPSAGVTRA